VCAPPPSLSWIIPSSIRVSLGGSHHPSSCCPISLLPCKTNFLMVSSTPTASTSSLTALLGYVCSADPMLADSTVLLVIGTHSRHHMQISRQDAEAGLVSQKLVMGAA
jgi:hypothetical protein